MGRHSLSGSGCDAVGCYAYGGQGYLTRSNDLKEMNELETSIRSRDLPTTSRQGRATGGRNPLTVVTGVTIDELVEDMRDC
jgi:hypothetical protein